jgi:hypothetical protein
MVASKALLNHIDEAESVVKNMLLAHKSMEHKLLKTQKIQAALLGVFIRVVQVYNTLRSMGEDVQFVREVVTPALRDTIRSIKKTNRAKRNAAAACLKAKNCLTRAKERREALIATGSMMNFTLAEKPILQLSMTCVKQAATVHVYNSQVSSSQNTIILLEQEMSTLFFALQTSTRSFPKETHVPCSTNMSFEEYLSSINLLVDEMSKSVEYDGFSTRDALALRPNNGEPCFLQICVEPRPSPMRVVICTRPCITDGVVLMEEDPVSRKRKRSCEDDPTDNRKRVCRRF